jgi:hypothetical protein
VTSPSPLSRSPLAGFSSAALTAAAVLVATAGAVLVAVVCAFLVPVRVGAVPVPVCWVLAAVGAVVTVRFAHRTTGSLLAAAAPTVAWFATTVVLASRRQEGDLVVTGGWVGVGLLFVGSLVFAAAAYVEVLAHARHRTYARIDTVEPVTRPAERGTM